MDLASIIGFIGACGMIAGAMISGGGLGPFVDVPSLLIVVGGTFFAVMYTTPLPTFLSSFGAMGKEFFPPVKSMRERHGDLQAVVKAWVDLAPAMGMIGTLVGLVLMLGNMSDPKAIGPAMAVALLTTLYGAFFANVMFAPMLTKLELYTNKESIYREMVVLGLRNIARGESPRNIQDQLAANLPPKIQQKLEAA